MPQGTRVADCVEKVKAKGGSVNPYAVCQSSTGQSYQTGKKIQKGASCDCQSTSPRGPKVKMSVTAEQLAAALRKVRR